MVNSTFVSSMSTVCVHLNIPKLVFVGVLATV